MSSMTTEDGVELVSADEVWYEACTGCYFDDEDRDCPWGNPWVVAWNPPCMKGQFIWVEAKKSEG